MITTHDNARGFVRSVLDLWRPSAVVKHDARYTNDGCIYVQIVNGADVEDVAVPYELPIREDALRARMASSLDGVIPIHLRAHW